MRFTFLLLSAVLIAALSVGCAPLTVEEAQEEVAVSEDALCTAIGAYIEAVAALAEVDADTTVDELNELTKTADQAYAQMVEAWKDLDEAQRDTVEAAVEEYRATVDSVSGEETLGDVNTNLQEGANALLATLDQLNEAVCRGE